MFQRPTFMFIEKYEEPKNSKHHDATMVSIPIYHNLPFKCDDGTSLKQRCLTTSLNRTYNQIRLLWANATRAEYPHTCVGHLQIKNSLEIHLHAWKPVCRPYYPTLEMEELQIFKTINRLEKQGTNKLFAHCLSYGHNVVISFLQHRMLWRILVYPKYICSDIWC